MIRGFDSDLDYYDAVNGPDDLQPNAVCEDCGAAYSKAEGDRSVWCDSCSDRRDAHTSALELKRMAKAILHLDLTTVRDVA